MNFLVFRVRKVATNSIDSDVAFVSCWISDPLAEEAYRKASEIINEHGWRIEQLLENHAVTHASYSSNDSGLQYYEQALVDGEVIVFFTEKTSRG